MASPGSIDNAARLRELGREVFQRGDAGFGVRGIGPGVRQLIEDVAQVALTGDPMTDWRAVRAVLETSPRVELRSVAREARHLRLLRRGAQIEGRFAEAWRAYGAYRDAGALLGTAIVEDQFAATTRPHLGVTVMTIHKAKGKEFDAVIVFESVYQRFLQRRGGDPERSARFNLHVAATRAKIAVTFVTPAQNPCPLLP